MKFNIAYVFLPIAAVKTFSWNPCYQEFTELFGASYECNVFNVPVDYDKPQGQKTQLSLVRHVAPDQENRIGSLFVNPGGPGGSGVFFGIVLGGLGSFLLGDVLNCYDIIGVDPRGIGLSTPLRCFGNFNQAIETFPEANFPFTEEGISDFKENWEDLNNQCLQRGNKMLGHTSTANVAHDFDTIRQALGEDKLNFYGLSYRTFLGMTYTNMFPDNVSAFVIDGNLDANGWSNLACEATFSNMIRSDQGAQATLVEFARQCDVSQEGNCPISGSAFDRISTLLEGLKTTPVPVTFPDGETVDVDFEYAVGFTLGPLYNPFAFPFLANFFALLEESAAPEELGATIDAAFTEAGFASKRGPPKYFNAAEGFPGVACSDSCNPTDYQVIFDTGKKAADEFGFFAELWNWAGSTCASWTTPDEDNFTGPYDSDTATPVLVVGNLYDPATRYENAVINAGLLPNSVLLTVDVPGHTALDLNDCADAQVSAYLADPHGYASSVVENKVKCDAEVNWFDFLAPPPPPPPEGEDFAHGSLHKKAMADVAFTPFV